MIHILSKLNNKLIYCFIFFLFFACSKKSQDEINEFEITKKSNKEIESGDYINPIWDLTKLINSKPNLSFPYYLRSYCNFELNNLNYALIDINKAIELNEFDENYFYLRANIYAKKKYFLESIKEYSKSLKLNPNYLNAYLYRGDCFQDIGNYEKAIIDYSSGISLDSSLIPVYGSRAYCKYAIKDFYGAIKDYNKVLLVEKNNAYAYGIRGNCKLELSDYIGAIRDYDSSIKYDSMDDTIYNNRGLCKLELKNYNEALMDFEKSIIINSKSNKAAHINISSCYYEMGRLLDAIKEINIAIKLDSIHDQDIFCLRAKYKMSLKDYQSAVYDYNICINNDSLYYESYLNRGKCKEMIGDLTGAQKDYLKAKFLKSKQ